MNERQSLGAFGMLANALGGGGDAGQSFPQSDADDLQSGARYIPGKVTMARRRGEKVVFNEAKHSWTMPDGSTVS